MSIKLTYYKPSGAIPSVLKKAFDDNGIITERVGWQSSTLLVFVDYPDGTTSEQIDIGATLVANHVAEDPIAQTQSSAEGDAASIPQWAGWTKDQAEAWYVANISAPWEAATTFAAAKPVITKLIAAVWAIVRMEIALRNHTWPHLQNNE